MQGIRRILGRDSGTNGRTSGNRTEWGGKDNSRGWARNGRVRYQEDKYNDELINDNSLRLKIVNGGS